MGRLKNKVAIITGAAGGMGAAEAKLFLEEGAYVVATDNQLDKLKNWVDAAKKEKYNIEYIQHDVASENSWKEVVEKTISLFGRIDILVNNAGIYPPFMSTENTTLEQWNRVLSINLTGPFIGAQLCIPYMKNAGGGSIINVSSIAGIVGGNGPAYTASKGGLRLLTKDMAVEFAKNKIRVNSIHPGGVISPMTEPLLAIEGVKESISSSCPMGRMGNVMEIAYAALYLASDESTFMTGAEIVIDGGATAK